MAPNQNQKNTTKDLASSNPSPRVRAVHEQALKHACQDQQKLLKKA